MAVNYKAVLFRIVEEDAARPALERLPGPLSLQPAPLPTAACTGGDHSADHHDMPEVGEHEYSGYRCGN